MSSLGLSSSEAIHETDAWKGAVKPKKFYKYPDYLGSSFFVDKPYTLR